ncbi:hypothetical protein BC628DRAFT_991079 [Trametes gibbosa]|nr:hypothetical protein BC628DRAFT_991079 [Trametes gibbosa]
MLGTGCPPGSRLKFGPRASSCAARGYEPSPEPRPSELNLAPDGVRRAAQSTAFSTALLARRRYCASRTTQPESLTVPVQLRTQTRTRISTAWPNASATAWAGVLVHDIATAVATS